MRKLIATAFAGITAGMVALFGFTAEAATVHTAPSVCKTGFRGQPDYDRHCLKRGTVGDAGVVWFYGGNDKALSDTTRRQICREVKRYHGMRNLVHELYGDVIYDSFKNNGQMEKWTASMGTSDCAALGIRN